MYQNIYKIYKIDQYKTMTMEKITIHFDFVQTDL